MKIVRLYERNYSKHAKKSHIVRALMKQTRQREGAQNHVGK